MSKTKVQTARRTRKSAREINRRQLAASCAAILVNPETPADLYNAVAETVTNWSNALLQEVQNEPAYILDCLGAHLKAEGKRTRA